MLWVDAHVQRDTDRIVGCLGWASVWIIHLHVIIILLITMNMIITIIVIITIMIRITTIITTRMRIRHCLFWFGFRL